MGLPEVSEHTLKGSLLHKIISDLRTKEDAIAFLPTAYNPAAGILEQEVVLEVQDADGDLVSVSGQKLDDKDAIREVQVDITGGTATGKALCQGNQEGAVDASIEARIEDGVCKVIVKATAAGTVLLGLTDLGPGLTVTSTATVTFS